MSSTTDTALAPPRIEQLPPRLLAGIAERHPANDPHHIPAQWQRFDPYIGEIAGQVGNVTYGVCHDFDREQRFEYVCAVEVAEAHGLPAGFTTVSVPAHRYLVFTHAGHLSGLRQTIGAIWHSYLPASTYKPVPGAMLERYGPEFDARTGMGGVELWVPIAE